MMAKWSRKIVGSIVKDKDPTKPDYVKINEDIVLKKGQCLNLESKKSQIASIGEAVKAGRMTSETAAAILENVNKMPEFVRFNIVRITKEE